MTILKLIVINKNMEEFRDIPGYEGLYQVSNLGNVKSLLKEINHFRGGDRIMKERILKPGIGNNGYYVVGLSKKGKPKTFTIHKLVAIVFLNHIPNGYKLVIDHINNIKTDNRVENLRVVTNRENVFKKQGDYSSQYKGVSFNKTNKKWVTQILINGKSKYLGSFTNEYDAHLKYQETLKTI